MKRIDHYRESVWNAPELTALEKHVAHAMTRWMDHDTLGDCRPGHAALMRRTSLGKRTIERTIASLVWKRWLVEVFHGGSTKGGERLASVYRGEIRDWRLIVASPEGATGVTESQDWRQRVAPPSQGPADDAATAGAASPSAKRTSSANGRHRDGCTCSRCYYASTKKPA